MEDEKYKIQKIKIANLSLDLKNYRFNPQNSQREAIKEMLKGNGGEKLYRLAKDIVNEGLNPSEMLMIAPIEDETSGRVMYKVLEGNRRVTALKLLGIPELIEWSEFQSLKTKFVKLHKAYIENPITSVVCVVFDNETDANLWIERKHAMGLQSGILPCDNVMSKPQKETNLLSSKHWICFAMHPRHQSMICCCSKS